MEKEKMDYLEVIKNDLVEVAKKINYENQEYCSEIIRKELEIICNIKKIIELKKKLMSTKLDEEKNDNNENIQNYLIEQEEFISYDGRRMYLFERKIRGGYVSEIDGFVPESIVRKLGLEHGDLVYATPIDNGDNYYIYELAKKGAGIDPDNRVQYNFCIVDKLAGRLVVSYSVESGEIRHNDSPYTIVLDENEVCYYGVSEGYIIDVAFQKDNPELAKILWVHKIDNDEIVVDANDYDQKKIKDFKKERVKNKKKVEQTLKDRTVLVIGNEPMKALYQNVIEERGGEFLWADAKDSLTQLDALVKRSDLVIFLLKVSGHVGMEHIKKMCKNNNVPFETTWSNGKSTVVRIVEEKL